jgi:Erv1 / Alr family
MRQLTLLVAIIIAFFITLSLLLMSHTSSLRSSVLHNNVHTPPSLQTDDIAKQASGISLGLLETDIARTNPITPALTQGHVIMPHLANETIKLNFEEVVADCRAELGRASWKLFHTILGRYPEKPTLDEREALKSYIHLFARLYPCGEWYADMRIRC